MIISPYLNTFSNKIQGIKNNCRISFCGKNKLDHDTFELQSKETQIVIKDVNGNEVPAKIIEEKYDDTTGFFGTDPKKFTLCANGNEIGYAITYISKEKDKIFVSELFTEENYARHYKGAGSALLKTIAEDSKKQGYKGRLDLSAAHYPPPFVFYYKNNLQVTGEQVNLYNAPIDYAARKNISVATLLPEGLSALHMELDENAADAFLKGERLFEKRNFKTIDTKTIDGKNYVTNLIQSPDLKENYLQIINLDASKTKQKYCARMVEEIDENGKHYLKLFNVNDLYSTKKVIEYANEMAQIAAKSLGLDYALITDEYIIE